MYKKKEKKGRTIQKYNDTVQSVNPNKKKILII